ncbi:MAG TPA: phosphatase PAP2 family protein [Gemmatimonadaceae bacterium]|nr:phosphatase PAP2 family protein [Gemmatimonadaceae bacterium]
MLKNGLIALLFSLTLGATVQAQTTDTLYSPKPLLKGADALLVLGFAAAAFASSPTDKYVTQKLQDPARQSNRYMHKGATFFRLIGDPGSLAVGGLTYVVGRVRGSRRAEDIGLHSVESVLLGGAITGVTKMVAGRARPYKDTANSRNFSLLRGFQGTDYQSFPSGHTTAAFAFASIISAETSHWWPQSRWVIGPIFYGGAALTGVSRIYNQFHWTSDVVAGAAIGTLTGIKVYRYTHSNPNNRVDKYFLRAGVQMSPGTGWVPLLSVAPKQ